GNDQQRADVELEEKPFAWTPLHVAAVDGQLGVARLLVEAGAVADKPDSSGWTALEHASLRGHMEIAKLLAAHCQTPEDSTAGNSDEEKTEGGSSPPEVVASLE